MLSLNSMQRDVVKKITRSASTLKEWKEAVRRVYATYGNVYYVDCRLAMDEGAEEAVCIPWYGENGVLEGVCVQQASFQDHLPMTWDKFIRL